MNMQFVEDSTEPAKRFGRDITNSCNTQPNPSAETLKLTTNANSQINHLPGEILTDILRSYVRKEWNGKVNPADRSEAWKAQCKRLQLLVGKYPLPYASNSGKNKRLRGSERSQAKKRVVMENEKGLKLILSGEKKREAALMKGTKTFWKKDQYGDYVYFDEASKRRIDENEYYRRYLRHLKDIGLARKHGHQDISRSPKQALRNEHTDLELTPSKVDVQLANAILTEHERSIQEAEVECWRAIKTSLESYEKMCTKLREKLLDNLATLNISDADQAQLKEGHPLLKSSELRTPPLPRNLGKYDGCRKSWNVSFVEQGGRNLRQHKKKSEETAYGPTVRPF